MKDILKKTILGFIILFSLSCGAAELLKELPIIVEAAVRNDCLGDNFLLLCSIRLAENGSRPDNAFGIMNDEADTFLLQAAWCAASIVNSRERWVQADRPTDFITFMGLRYCPPDAHPLNEHWVGNVKYYYNKFKEYSK